MELTREHPGPRMGQPGAKLSILSRQVDLISDASVPGPQEMDTWLAKEVRAPETQEGHSPRSCPSSDIPWHRSWGTLPAHQGEEAIRPQRLQAL